MLAVDQISKYINRRDDDYLADTNQQQSVFETAVEIIHKAIGFSQNRCDHQRFSLGELIAWRGWVFSNHWKLDTAGGSLQRASRKW